MKSKRAIPVQVQPVVSLISINQAAALGIERLRKPIWATPEDHLKIDIIDSKPGLWTHLYAPFNLKCNGRDPVDIFVLNMDYGAVEYVPYQGALPDSDQYKIKCALYNGCLKG